MSTANDQDTSGRATIDRAPSRSRASSATRAPLLDPALQRLLGPLNDAARRRIESVVVAGFAAGLLDHNTALDLARGLQWVRSGRAPALTVEATVHELTGMSWPETGPLWEVSRAAAAPRGERGTSPGRRPAGSVRCPDAHCCNSCSAAQQLVNAGRRIASALAVIDTLERHGALPAAQKVPARATGTSE